MGALSAFLKERPQAFDLNGFNNAVVLTVASTNVNHSVPAGAAWARCVATALAYCQPGGGAAIPAADITNGSGPVALPAGEEVLLRVGGLSTLGFISATAAAIVQVTFLKDAVV